MTHILLIPDGHRRYAVKRILPLKKSYLAAAKTIRKCIGWFLVNNNLEEFSFFSFSYANFITRPYSNKKLIFKAINNLVNELSISNLLIENKIRFKAIGLHKFWPKFIKKKIYRLEKKTQGFKNKRFNLLFCYSGEIDLEKAIKKCIKNKQKLTSKNILKNSSVENPIDYIIRTANEKRISDCPLLPICYSEFYFTKKLFPELNHFDIDKSVNELRKRKRTFGA